MNASSSNELSVRFWGVRGSIPAPGPGSMRYGGNTSCLEVRYGDQLIILDAGSGLRSLGQELQRKANGQPIEAAMLLSHTHWDHIQGLPFFAPGYDSQNCFRLMAGPGQGDRVRQGLRDQMSPMQFPVPFEQMTGLAAVEELSATDIIGHFSVRTFSLNHPGGCTGFRLDAGGKSMAYLPDHEPYDSASPAAMTSRSALVEFVRGIDLLILDTQYTADEYVGRRGWGHGSVPESLALALDAGVRELVLYHHDPSHHDGQIDAMLAMTRHLASGTSLRVSAAQEGSVMVLETSPARGPVSPVNFPSLSDPASFNVR